MRHYLMSRSIGHRLLPIGLVSHFILCASLSLSFTRPLAPTSGSRGVPTSAMQAGEEARALEQGRPQRDRLAGGGARSYRLPLAAGEFARVVVEQQGLDLVVALFGPDGKELAEVDSPFGERGPEPVFWAAEIAGSYRVEVRSLATDAAPGGYEIRLEERRAAVPSDEKLLRAQKSYAEGLRLMSQGTAEASRRALEKFEQSLRLWQAAGEREREAAVLDILGLINDNLGEKREALACYNRALPLLHETGPPIAEAILLSNVGKIYSDLGENQNALGLYEHALKVQQELGDLASQTITLSNIAEVYDDRGEYDKSLEYSTRALALSRAAGHTIEATILHNIGAAYLSLGELQKALDNEGQALRIAQARREPLDTANSLNTIGLIYSHLGEYGKALEYYEQALRARVQSGDRRGQATTLNNIGVTYGAMGEFEKALGYFDRALPIKRAIEDRNGEAFVLNNIGRTRNDLRRYQEAVESYERGLGIVRDTGDRTTEASLLHNLGQAQRGLGKNVEARDSFEKSLRLRRLVRDRQGEAETLAALAGLEGEGGDLGRARLLMKEALDLFESQRTKIFSQELRASYFASVQDFYRLNIELLMRLQRQRPAEGYAAEALHVSERARARSLIELLTESHADIRQGIDPALLERERKLQQAINASEARRLRLASDPAQKAQLPEADAELERLTGEQQQVEALIRVNSPRYAHLTQPQPLSLAEIQTRLLDPDTLLLEYSLGDERSYLWAVTPSSMSVFELAPRGKIEAAATRVYDLLTARNRGTAETDAGWAQRVAQEDAAFAGAAAELSEMILRPAAAQLGSKRLVIVSEGALQRVPFAALTVAPPGAESSAPPPLIVSHEIVTLPSASTLAVLRSELAGRAPAPKAVAVLADPVFDAADARVRRERTAHAPGAAVVPPGLSSEELTRAAEAGDVDLSLPLERLTSTRREAAAITAHVPARERLLALDFDASRATATGPALRRYRVVHFATHALISNAHPDLSGIVLSLVDEQGRPSDGFLRIHDIFNMRLPAELVVLSACRTGLGKDIRGEGMMGMTRAFMYAGARRAVVSLWSVNDRATAELMERFYRKMLGGGGERPAAALRAAQVEMWRDGRWKSPYYWGAFIMQGEWR
jgi:CHAT domain-containing protein/Tfp pilus assembly protein PilF